MRPPGRSAGPRAASGRRRRGLILPPFAAMNGHLQRSINQSAARQNGVICVRPARRGCTDGRTALPAGWRVRGDREAIAPREGSDLDLPEPALRLVVKLFAAIVGLTRRPT